MIGRIAEFFAYATERHAAYVRRSRGEPAPWSKDPIVAGSRFCNVYRELDRTTVWLMDWYKAHEDAPLDLQMFNAAVARRCFNHPASIEAVGWIRRWNPERFVEIVRARGRDGLKTFANAYRIPAGGVGIGRGEASQLPEFLARTMTPLWRHRHEFAATTLRETTEWLCQFNAFGPFFAYQIALDLLYTPTLRGCADMDTWAAVGPGSTRGLNRVFGYDLDARRTQPEALELMSLLVEEQDGRWPREYPRLRVQDVEHTLCEFDKYERIRLGDAPMKRFKPFSG